MEHAQFSITVTAIINLIIARCCFEEKKIPLNIEENKCIILLINVEKINESYTTYVYTIRNICSFVFGVLVEKQLILSYKIFHYHWS